MAETGTVKFDYKSQIKATWCPGCGDFAVLSSLQKACADLNINPKDILVVSGIGCSSNFPGFIHAYGFHGLHGRALPVATGAKLANPDLTVVVTGGDGDGYGIGLGHFIHTMRRNLDITYLVMDNQVYGLTTGQASPTSQKNHKSKSTPTGQIEIPVNPIALALISGATFIARGFSGEPNHLAEIMAKAVGHKGFALVDIMSPCVTYNKINTYQWFRERVYKLSEKGHESSDWNGAMAKAREWGDKVPIGIFYETQLPTYEDEEPALAHGPLAKQPLALKNWQDILLEFT